MKKQITQRVVMAALLIATFTTAGFAQDLETYISREENQVSATTFDSFNGLQVGNAQSTTLLGEKELMMFIGHRFGKISGGLYELFGLDEATMRLGFDYGFTPWLTAGFGRSTYEKTWDIRVKARLLNQANPGTPLNMVLYGQMGYNSIRDVFPESKDNIPGRNTYSGQILISRDLKRFSFQVAPIYLHSAYDPILRGSADMFSVGLAGRVGVTRIIDLTAEYYAAVSKPDDFIQNPLTLGMEFDTGGHLFQLVMSNAQGMIDKAVLLNTTGTWGDGDIYFGFNLIRIFY